MIRYFSTPPSLTSGNTFEEMADSAGSIYSNNEGRKLSYRAVTSGVAVTASGTGFSLQGSSTKTVRVTRVACKGVLTTAAQVLIQVNRCTAAASSVSNQATVTPRLLDTGNAAATAVALTYTAATLGTGNVLLASDRAFYAPATALATGTEFTFGTRNTQSLVLRGTAEFMQITVAASGYTGALFDYDVEFTEE